MLKTVAVAGLLAFCGAASAAASTWNFAFTGFYDQSAGVFSSDYRLAGSFTGSDANEDGVLDKSEITALVINGTNYIACGSYASDYYKCGAERFSYHIGGALDFVAGESGSDPEGWVGGAHFYTVGDREWQYHYSPETFQETSYYWTSDTRFEISKGLTSSAQLPAVPEPGTWAMLATGLLLVSTAGLRRRRDGAVAVRR